jgi:dihydrolipoamide dehydrogenase
MVMGEATIETKVVVIGGGPGGYAVAFRAADLGLDVTLVDKKERPGGVCLYSGCIPSKALMHLTHLLSDARDAADLGLHFSEPKIELEEIQAWKNQVVNRLGDGLLTLCEQRNVQLLQGHAQFESSNQILVSGHQTTHVKFEHAILATGSSPIPLQDTTFENGSRLISSDQALNITNIPERLLIVGANNISMGLGSIYANLGSRVTIVDRMDSILPSVDRDLVRPLMRKAREMFEAIYLETKVSKLEEHEDYITVTLDGEVDTPEQNFEKVLVTIGRKPNSGNLGLEHTQIDVNEDGFVQVDDQQRTTEDEIYAIGDLVGGSMLAHKAMYEGKIAAEVIAGEPAAFDARAVPSVVYTDPEIAWAGLMESDARQDGREVRVARFPWKASGRAMTNDAALGLTKLIIEPQTERILGVGITGQHAGELISEGVLAIEMGAVVEDLAMPVYPHPTLSETIEEAADVFLGQPTHIAPQK